MDIFNVAKTVSIIKIAQDIHGLNIQQQGGRLVAVCPFHADSKPSCYFDEQKNVFKCFGCNAAGSGIDYVIQAGLADKPEDAAAYIVQRYGLGGSGVPLSGKRTESSNGQKNKNSKKSGKDKPYTLRDYAQAKGLPEDFLRSIGVEEEGGKVRIPYHLGECSATGAPGAAGPTAAAIRYRRWDKFWWARGSKLVPYELDRIDRFLDQEEYVILVEGESDTQTLWLHEYPAIGIPGAQNFKSEWTQRLLPFKKIFLHKEPDKAGQNFVKRIANFLKKADYRGKILVFSTPGHKDPNDLHRADPDNKEAFKSAFESALANAHPPTPDELGKNTSDSGPDGTIRTPDDVIALAQENPADIFTEQALGALAMMSIADLARVKTEIKGKVPLRDFDKAVKETKRELKKHLRIAKQGEEPERPSLCDAIEGCPLDIPVPDGWQVNESGVYELVTRHGDFGTTTSIEKCFPVPVVLSSVLQPLDTTEESVSYELAWLNGSWHHNAFPANVLFDRARLTSAAGVGIPVDSENSKGLLRWMAALRDTREIPSKKIVTRCGWHGKRDKLFVLGRDIVARNTGEEDAEVGAVEDGASGDTGTNTVDWTPAVRSNERELVGALHTKGDKEAQLEIVTDIITRYPLAGFLIGTSAAAPLLRLLYANGRLEIHGFIVEVASDQAGIGKSTGNELAASIWGNPGGLAKTFDRTSVAWEVLLHTLCDCPVFLEETQMATKENMATKLVYALALGMGRERGNRSGGMRKTRQFWNTVLLASERSLKTFAAREGIEARVISLPPVFGRRTPERGKELRELRTQYFSHYGHMGQLYVRFLLEEVQQYGCIYGNAILEVYDTMVAYLEKRLPIGADGETVATAMRMATRVAACWLGLLMLLQGSGISFGDATEITEPCAMKAWEYVVKNLDTAPLWKRGLAVIQSWAAENVHRIAGMEAENLTGMSVKAPSNYIGGLVQAEKTDCVGFLPNAFDEAIKRYLDIEGQTIRDGLIREGIIVTDKQGRATRSQRIRPAGGEQFQTRVICIPTKLVFPDDDES
jgi:hypothetical protein